MDRHNYLIVFNDKPEHLSVRGNHLKRSEDLTFVMDGPKVVAIVPSQYAVVQVT